MSKKQCFDLAAVKRKLEEIRSYRLPPFETDIPISKEKWIEYARELLDRLDEMYHSPCGNSADMEDLILGSRGLLELKECKIEGEMNENNNCIECGGVVDREHLCSGRLCQKCYMKYIEKYKPYGYAPGNYMNYCITCNKQFTGDKYSRVCKECADVHIDKELERIIVEDSKMFGTIKL